MSHAERIAFLEALPGETISPSELAKVLGGRPYLYNLAAKQGMLTLPHVWRGRNLRICKAPLPKLLQTGEQLEILQGGM